MSWLVTGGAGYIGAHVVRALMTEHLDPVVLDDLSTGHREFVPDGVPLVIGSVLDTDLVADTLRRHDCRGVIHVAGFKYAGVSVQRPVHTYQQNVTGTATVLAAMEDTGVQNLVFSSSAAVYGTPTTELVTEKSPTRPESPYGESKLVAEWLIADQARATGLRATCLRYFNVVGSGDPAVFDTSPHNLFPLVIEALIAGRTPTILGTDHDTPDGTCVRDYVDIAALAHSHAVAARVLAAGGELRPVYNLGSGTGLSVRQIMDAMALGTGIDFTPEEGRRRPGDPARIVAAGDLAAADLEWAQRRTVPEMVSAAWQARRGHPELVSTPAGKSTD